MPVRLSLSKKQIEASQNKTRNQHDFATITARRAAIRQHANWLVGQVLQIKRPALTMGARGAAEVALARQLAMYLARVCFPMSYAELGRLFGRDRTTVAHAIAIIEERREEPRFDDMVCLLEHALKLSIARCAIE